MTVLTPFTTEKYGAEKNPPLVVATPFIWVNPASIPRRRWLYGDHFVRQFVSLTVAPGGYGKSTLEITEALAISTGLPLLGVIPDERVNVWYWNGEDPLEELQRRIAATALHYRIPPAEIEAGLYLDSGRKAKIVIAEVDRNGAKIAVPVVNAVIETIRDNDIGLMVVDPFVSSHRIAENDNPMLEAVAATWAEIADVTGCAIELVHHSRKTGGGEVTVEDARGGSALLAKARSARVLNGMSEDEAQRAGVENRRTYFRLQNGKANLAPPVDKASWFHLEGVEIGNGDNVAIVTTWAWPDALDGVSVADLRKVRAAVAAGRWRENSQARDWVGNAVAQALDLDPTNKAHRAKISVLLKMWIASRALVVVQGEDEQRRKRDFVEVGRWDEEGTFAPP